MKIPFVLEKISVEKISFINDIKLTIAVWECSLYISQFIEFLRAFSREQKEDFENYRDLLIEKFVKDCLKLNSNWQKPIKDFIDYDEPIKITNNMIAKGEMMEVMTLGQKVADIKLLNPDTQRGVVLVFNGRGNIISTRTWLKKNWKQIKKAMDGYYPRQNIGKKNDENFDFYLERRKYLYQTIKANSPSNGKRLKNGIYDEIWEQYSSNEDRFGTGFESYKSNNHLWKYYHAWEKRVDEYEFAENVVWKIWARNLSTKGGRKLAVKKVVNEGGKIGYFPITRNMSSVGTNQSNSKVKFPDYSRKR